MATAEQPSGAGLAAKLKGIFSPGKEGPGPLPPQALPQGMQAVPLQPTDVLPSVPTHPLPVSRPAQPGEGGIFSPRPTTEGPQVAAAGTVISPRAPAPTTPQRTPALAAPPSPMAGAGAAAQTTTIGVRPGRIGEVGAPAPAGPVSGVVSAIAGAIPAPVAQTIGIRPGRIGEGGVAAGAREEERMPSPVQGDRVKVQRMGGAPLMAGARRMQEVEVRPEFETRPATAEEIAALKEREHALRVAEERRRAEAKRREIWELKRQAETLEVETQGLLAEASVEKLKVDKQLEQKARVEQREWSFYAQAEAAERTRREVVTQAAPVVHSAEEREVEALRLRQAAADTQYHAEVLERKAKALLMESREMEALARERAAEAQALAAQQMLAQQEVEEVRMRHKEITTGDLPTYIDECLAEIGRMQRRITELRSEIEWAEHQLEATHYEGITWERLIMTKQALAGQLILRHSEARREMEAALARSQQAAQEAREPTDLAERKYEEAYRLSEQAQEVEEEARRLHEEAYGIVGAAAEPEKTRQELLREAGQAELVAKQMEAQAGLAAERVGARLHEAEVKAETAAHLAQQAQVAEGEVARVQRVVEAEEQLAESYGAQRERHAAAPPLLAAA